MSSLDAPWPPAPQGPDDPRRPGDDPAEAARRRFPMRPSHAVDWNATAKRYTDLVYSIAVRRGLQRSDVEDVFQNTWLVALSKAEVPEEQGMAAWLAAIATYKALAAWQRRRDDGDAGGLCEDRDDPDQPGPDAVLERAEEEQKVREALAKLPSRDRLLLLELFATEPPRNHAEIARDLGLAAGSIGTIRQRALDRLSKLVAA